MKYVLLASLLLPLAAQADERCAHSQPRNLQLDLAGVKTVVFDIGASNLDLRASANSSGKIDGRACASDAKFFERMTLTQEKHGDQLTVRALRNGDNDSGSSFNFDLFGISFNRYAYMKLQANVPDNLAVQLKLGSGDAVVAGAQALDATVGSGDLTVSNIRGPFSGSIGSGDIEASDIGGLDLRAIGSGDVTVRQVRGTSRIGRFGSGDIEIKTTHGPVEIGAGGSGDVTLTGIGGGVRIDAIGSGDIDLTDIGGDITIGSIGSGDVDVDGARGDLTVRAKGSGDIDHRDVSGRVDVPKRR